MGKPESPAPVKPFAGILYREEERLAAAIDQLTSEFGPADYTSHPVSFDGTDYYEPEMGTGLKRVFASLERLQKPDFLPAFKIATNRIEERLSESGARTVNLDSGYVDFYKVVLASTKVAGTKVYLSDGIYADMTLRYEKGNFYPFEWAFLDFRSGRYNEIFLRIREKYKSGLKRGSDQRQ